MDEATGFTTHSSAVPRPPFLVATVADMCVDLILHGDVRPRFHQQEQIVQSYSLELGGSANIFACQMAKLGVPTAVLGCVGADPFGDLVLQRLTQAGVHLSLVRRSSSFPTGLGVHLSAPDDRAILTVLGTIDATQPSDLPAAPAAVCRHWHVASPFLLRSLTSAWPEFLRRAKSSGVTVSLDPNWDTSQAWNIVADLLPWIDVLLPNEAEALALTGAATVEQAALQLARSCPLVVVKCGPRGAIAVHRDRIVEAGPSLVPTPDGRPIDTVGAGDNFDAGFLCAWLAAGSIGECLSLGSLCAAASLACPGGIQGQYRRPSAASG